MGEFGLSAGVGIIGLLIGILFTWIWMNHRLIAEMRERASVEEVSRRVPDLEKQVTSLSEKRDALLEYNSALRQEVADLTRMVEKEQEASRERLKAYEEAENKLADAFKALSAKALEANNEQFLQLARSLMDQIRERTTGELDLKQKEFKNIVSPLSDSLNQFKEQVHRIETERIRSYSSLTDYLNTLKESQERLSGETRNLVKALRKPNVRGRWGEVQLRNVVEFAGMEPHCDFVEQESVRTLDGGLRPDMVIHMPGGKQVVVDSKTPVEAYLDAVEVDDAGERQTHLKRHAAHVKTQIDKLSSKKYWDQFDASPEFVVLFLPGENFFSAAMEQNPGLIEYALEQKVLISTPTTLIALLKTIDYGWRQKRLENNAQIISTLGRELHERIQTLVNHFSDLKKGLDRAVQSYNKAVGSLESRVLVTARRFRELGAGGGGDIPSPDPIETASRALNTTEEEEKKPD